MDTAAPQFWRKCSSCKKEIAFGSDYYLCSVSTCRHKRTGLRFCSVPCWDAHLGFANHRESWAEEARSPTREVYAAELKAEEGGSTEDRAPVRKVVEAPGVAASSRPAAAQGAVETLVVVSRVKDIIRNRSEFNTSQCCIDTLTQRVLDDCLRGIENARAAGRKTVMGRDIK